jgi:hypothetical protein
LVEVEATYIRRGCEEVLTGFSRAALTATLSEHHLKCVMDAGGDPVNASNAFSWAAHDFDGAIEKEDIAMEEEEIEPPHGFSSSQTPSEHSAFFAAHGV